MFGIFFSFIASHILYLALHLETGSFPRPLTPRQEVEAFEAFKKGDMAARDRIIRHNLRLVAHVVKKYYSLPGDAEDLISIGTIGLIKAVNSFDNTKQARFSTYASRCIDNAILSQMRLWFRINPLRAEKHQNGVFWHRFPRIFTYSAPLRRAM